MSHAPVETKPEHVALAKALAGTGSEAQKTAIVRTWKHFAREGIYFAGGVAARIQTVRYDVVKGAGGRESAELEVALRVEDDMINGFGTLHGGCSAFLVDITTSICLTGLTTGHVTLSLDIVCHAAAPQGAMLRIVARTTSVGKRVLSTRCEISDKDSGRLYVTGTHIKMPVSPGPKL